MQLRASPKERWRGASLDFKAVRFGGGWSSLKIHKLKVVFIHLILYLPGSELELEEESPWHAALTSYASTVTRPTVARAESGGLRGSPGPLLARLSPRLLRWVTMSSGWL